MGTCKKITGMIGAYVYGDLSPDEMRYVRLHAEECSKCSHEIEDRIRTIALIPTDTPKLTDEERQRVMWTVKGAIRAKSERRGFSLFRPTFTLTLLLAAAFVGGAMLGYSKIQPKVIVKQVPVENRQPLANPEKSIAANAVPKPASKPISVKHPTDVSVAVQPFVRYPIQEIYRGSIDREAQKQEDPSKSIIGDKPSENTQGDQSADSLGPSIVPVPDPLTITGTPAPVEPQCEKPASSDNN
ncbi:MAG: zf-HC2 domain-containing protein [Armatimonadota bacterium]